jgi:hypothetical protein
MPPGRRVTKLGRENICGAYLWNVHAPQNFRFILLGGAATLIIYFYLTKRIEIFYATHYCKSERAIAKPHLWAFISIIWGSMS